MSRVPTAGGPGFDVPHRDRLLQPRGVAAAGHRADRPAVVEPGPGTPRGRPACPPVPARPGPAASGRPRPQAPSGRRSRPCRASPPSRGRPGSGRSSRSARGRRAASRLRAAACPAPRGRTASPPGRPGRPRASRPRAFGSMTSKPSSPVYPVRLTTQLWSAVPGRRGEVVLQVGHVGVEHPGGTARPPSAPGRRPSRSRRSGPGSARPCRPRAVASQATIFSRLEALTTIA